LPVGAWLAEGARLAVVLLFVFSVISVSIPIASGLASAAGAVRVAFGMPMGAGLEAEKPPKLVERGPKLCWEPAHSVTVPLVNGPDGQMDSDAIRRSARPVWEAEVTKKHGAESAGWDFSAVNQGVFTFCDGPKCQVILGACKPRPIECKEAPHAVEAGVELLPDVDGSMGSDIVNSVRSGLKERWKYEVVVKYGQEWIATADKDFETHRTFGRPIEEECKEQRLDNGRRSVQCRFATAACKAPASLQTSDAPVSTPAVQPSDPSSGGRR
jgi:hypothetical protein